MPQVPTYDNLRASIDAGGTNTFRAPNGPLAGEIAGGQIQRAGEAVQGLGGRIGQIAADMADQANQVRVADATNQMLKARTNLQVEAMSLTGRAALERPDNKSLMDEYGEKFNKVSKEISAGLGNVAQQRMFDQNATSAGHQFIGALGSHTIQQQKQFEADTENATVDQAAKQATAFWSMPNMVAESKGMMQAVVAKNIARNGWDATKDKALIADFTDKVMGPMHAGVIQGMLHGGRPEDAQAYFKDNIDTMSAKTKMALADAIQTGAAAEKAQRVGAELADKFDYLHTKDAQKAIDAMNVPASEKTAIRQELEHRHAVAQSDADKTNATLVGKLDEMVQRGMSQAAIEKSPEFMAVRDKGTALKLIRERTEHAVNLQNAVESRDYTRVMRLRADQTYNTMGKMFAYMDPTVLSGMSRAQVANLQLELGAENTGHLLNRWDSFEKSSSKLVEAKIDNDLFNTTADALGMHPYAATSEDAKRALGNARNNVEAAIAQKQAANGNKQLTREEKAGIMSDLIRAEIKTKGFWFLPDGKSNLLQVSPEDVKDIAVPAVDRGQIIDAARRQRNDPKYVPTDQEIGAAYRTQKIKGVVRGQ